MCIYLFIYLWEECNADVTAIDQYGSRMAQDPDTGKMIEVEVDNDLTQAVSGVVWSDGEITMTRTGGQRVDTHGLYIYIVRI
jgi:hypothetical protein